MLSPPPPARDQAHRMVMLLWVSLVLACGIYGVALVSELRIRGALALPPVNAVVVAVDEKHLGRHEVFRPTYRLTGHLTHVVYTSIAWRHGENVKQGAMVEARHRLHTGEILRAGWLTERLVTASLWRDGAILWAAVSWLGLWAATKHNKRNTWR